MEKAIVRRFGQNWFAPNKMDVKALMICSTLLSFKWYATLMIQGGKRFQGWI
jgi:hypothetical protein